MKRKTELSWFYTDDIVDFLEYYGLFLGEDARLQAERMKAWIADLLDMSDVFPDEQFEKYCIVTRNGTFYINILFEVSLGSGVVYIMPDMYGVVPDNSPSWEVLCKELDSDRQYLEEDK